MPHEPRLAAALRHLVHSRRTAALATLLQDAARTAAPQASFVPFATADLKPVITGKMLTCPEPTSDDIAPPR